MISLLWRQFKFSLFCFLFSILCFSPYSEKNQFHTTTICGISKTAVAECCSPWNPLNYMSAKTEFLGNRQQQKQRKGSAWRPNIFPNEAFDEVINSSFSSLHGPMIHSCIFVFITDKCYLFVYFIYLFLVVLGLCCFMGFL